MSEAPPESIKSLIEKTCQFLQDNGFEHEEFLKSTKSNEKNFSFLFPTGEYHQYYKSVLYGSRVGGQILGQIENPNIRQGSSVTPIQTSSQTGNSSKNANSQAINNNYPVSGNSSSQFTNSPNSSTNIGSQSVSSQQIYNNNNSVQKQNMQANPSQPSGQSSQVFASTGGAPGQYNYQQSSKSPWMQPYNNNAQQYQQPSYQNNMPSQYVQQGNPQQFQPGLQQQYQPQQQYSQGSSVPYQGQFQQASPQSYQQQTNPPPQFQQQQAPSQYQQQATPPQYQQQQPNSQQYQMQNSGPQYPQASTPQYQPQASIQQYQTVNSQTFPQAGQQYTPTPMYQQQGNYVNQQQYQQQYQGQQTQQPQQQYPPSQSQFISGGQLQYPGNNNPPQATNYQISAYNSSNNQVSSNLQNQANTAQPEAKKKNRWGVLTTAASEIQTTGAIQNLDPSKKGAITSQAAPGLNIGQPFMHLNNQLSILFQSNNLTNLSSKVILNKTPGVGGGGGTAGLSNATGKGDDLEQRGVPLEFDNPDDIPVGVLVEMIKQQQKKFIEKYAPLDPANAPAKVLSYSEVQPENIRSKHDSFLKFVSEERESERRFKRKMEREREKELASSNDKKGSRGDKFSSKKRDSGSGFLYNDYVNEEMSMRSDGQVLGGFSQGEERKGLGNNFEDMYSKFRKQRSYHYHVSAEERSLNRDQPQLCYVCQMPGHIARDCKFGLT